MSADLPERHFSIPFELEDREEYSTWFYDLIQEMRETVGAAHAKYLIAYLRGENAEAQLPKDSEEAYYVKGVTEDFAYNVLRGAVKPKFPNTPKPGETGLQTWKRYHEFCCNMNTKEHIQYLIFWARQIESRPPYDYVSSIVQANGFSKKDIDSMKEIMSYSHMCRSNEDYFKFIVEGAPANISDRVLNAAESAAKASQELMDALDYKVEVKPDVKSTSTSTCSYCNKKGHTEVQCKKKKMGV